MFLLKKWRQRVVVGRSWLCSGVLLSPARVPSLHKPVIWSLCWKYQFSPSIKEICTGFQRFHFQDLLGVTLENSSCPRREKVWPPWHKFDLTQDISIRAYFFLVSAGFFAGQLLTCAPMLGAVVSRAFASVAIAILCCSWGVAPGVVQSAKLQDENLDKTLPWLLWP